MNKLKGWDIESGGSGDNKVEFTKFPEGLVKIRLVDTVPNIRWTHWIDSQRVSVNCAGRDCPICDIRKRQKENKEPYTYPMGRRFALQIINRNTGKLEIMEQGITFFEDLKMVLQMAVEKDVSITEVDIAVRRKGLGKNDTAYRIDLDEEYPYTDEDKALIKENKIDLDEYFKANTPEQITRIIAGESYADVMSGNTEDKDDDEVVELE